jgi:hypothetical protein
MSQEFISLSTSGSFTHSHVLFLRASIVFVYPCVIQFYDGSSPLIYINLRTSSDLEIEIGFDLNTNLQDAVDFYKSLLLQLGSDVSGICADKLIPSRMRHLLPTQPELIGRP